MSLSVGTGQDDPLVLFMLRFWKVHESVHCVRSCIKV